MRADRRKKVAHVTFDMRIGGAEEVIRNLVTQTDSEKFDVSVVCLNSPVGPIGCLLQDAGFRVDALNRRPGFDTSLIRQIHDYALREGIDILHCHQYTPYTYGLLGSFFTGARVIFTEHGRFYPDQCRIKRVLLNPLFSLMTSDITAISESTRDALARFENFPRKKIRVVYNGLNGSISRLASPKGLKANIGLEAQGHVLGTVARLDPIKNQGMMLRALHLIHRTHPGTCLVIIGDGPERGRLEGITSDLGLGAYVIFTGFRQDARLFYQIMDIFLLTSFSEGTAMTLLEAMASSVPTIATDVGGNREIIEDQKTGFIIPSNDEKDLSEKVCILLGDEGLRKRMGQAGRKRFEERFTVEQMVRAYESMYTGCA